MAMACNDYCYISELEISLLHEIFFKLPIKCVSQCKCVCPEWNSLLSNPIFSDGYAAKSTFTALLCRSGPDPAHFVPDTFNLVEICDNGDAIESRIVLKLPDPPQSSLLCLVGSSNGLLCMKFHEYLYDSVFITNPLSGDTIEVPKHRGVRGANKVDFQFGFCLKEKKFKVLKFAYKSFSDCSPSGCEILTVGVDDRWRPLPHSFVGLPMGYDFVALDDDGFLYWVPRLMGPGYRPDFIQTFDLAEEKFGRIALPPSLSLDLETMDSAAFGNQLCYVECSVPSEISIWKLTRKSVVESSWTKVVISTSWLPVDKEDFCFFPVTSLKNGEMLFQYSDDSLVSCNIEQKRCSEIKLNGDGRCSVPGYTPSFSTRVAQVIEREQGLLSRADAKINVKATEYRECPPIE